MAALNEAQTYDTTIQEVDREGGSSDAEPNWIHHKMWKASTVISSRRNQKTNSRRN